MDLLETGINPRYRGRSTSLLVPEQQSTTRPNEQSLDRKASDLRSLDAPCEKFRVGGARESHGFWGTKTDSEKNLRTISLDVFASRQPPGGSGASAACGA